MNVWIGRWIQLINATLYLYSVNKRWSGYGIQNPNKVLSRTEIRHVGSMAARWVSQSDRSYIRQTILINLWSIIAHRRYPPTHSETIKISANALRAWRDFERASYSAVLTHHCKTTWACTFNDKPWNSSQSWLMITTEQHKLIKRLGTKPSAPSYASLALIQHCVG